MALVVTGEVVVVVIVVVATTVAEEDIVVAVVVVVVVVIRVAWVRPRVVVVLLLVMVVIESTQGLRPLRVTMIHGRHDGCLSMAVVRVGPAPSSLVLDHCQALTL
jgi:hypothetical protein